MKLKGRRPRSRQGASLRIRPSQYREPAPEEVELLELISEQVAIPFDQLVRFLGASLEEAIPKIEALNETGCVLNHRFFPGDFPWFWLNSRGVRRTKAGYGRLTPRVSLLPHKRAVNEIRLHLSERAPQGVWVCERAIYLQREPGAHLPDAIFEIGGERHAIEVELSPKGNRRTRQIIAEQAARYDAVIYFCAPRVRSLLEGLQEEHRWPNLIIRDLAAIGV